MRDDAKLRIRRLVTWIKRYRSDLLDDLGAVSPKKLAEELVVDGEKPATTYWSDVLSLRDGKSFGDKAARKVEDRLTITPMHLDGYGWPFDEVEFERWDRLNERQKGRVEKAILDEIDAIEAEGAKKANGTQN